MTFKLVYYSQQDPQWKEDKLGFGTGAQDTIGYVGCALTSVAMLLSGYGFTITPRGLNENMKAADGFSGDLIRWDMVNKVVPQVSLKTNIKCETSDAPLGQIDAALVAGHPVVVRVDGSASPGLQWHYVMVYAKKGNDYLMLDPWPYQPGTEKEDLLMARYGRGNPLQRAIQHVLIFEASGEASGPIGTPNVSATPSSTTAPSDLFQITIKPSVGKSGAKIHTQATVHSPVATTAQVKEILIVLEDKKLAKDKIGKGGKMISVRTASGQQGFVDGEDVKVLDSSVPKTKME
jgi:hypothetical protein